MITPICKSCAWAKTLCPQCSQELNSGNISNLDVEISRILYRINETHNISRASFCKSINFSNVVVILTDCEPGLLIGKRGIVVSAISHALNRRVRILRKDSDVKRLISDLISPAKLVGINSVYSNKSEKFKIRIQNDPKSPLYLDVPTLQSVIKSWLKKDVELFIE